MVNASSQPLFTPGKYTRYRLYGRLCGPQGLIWTDAGNFALTGILSPTAQLVATRALPSAHIIHILSPCKPACRLCWCSYISRNMYGFTRPCTSSAIKLLCKASVGGGAGEGGDFATKAILRREPCQGALLCLTFQATERQTVYSGQRPLKASHARGSPYPPE